MKKLFGLIILTILISGCLFRDPYKREFAGVTLNFRANLNEAEKIPLYPSEKTLRDVLLSDSIEEIGIAYIPNESENSFYLAASYELAYKLTIINKYYFQHPKPIVSIALNSTEEVFDLSSVERAMIILLGPSKTDATAVTIRSTVVFAEGKDFSEVNRTYTDLDLAVDKILLVLMKS